jgi:hypothetical protein
VRTEKAVLKPVNCVTRTVCRWGKLKEGDCLEDLDVDERMLLEWMIKKQDAEDVDLISLKGRNVISCT